MMNQHHQVIHYMELDLNHKQVVDCRVQGCPPSCAALKEVRLLQ